MRLKCKFIDGGIVLGPNRLTVCCVVHHNNDSPVLVDCENLLRRDSTDGQNDHERIHSIVNKSRMNFQQLAAINKLSDCVGCPNLCRDTSDNEEASDLIRFININASTVCQLRCVYCYTVIGGFIGIEPAYDVYNFLRHLCENDKIADNADILFTGGEPLLFPQFDKIITLFKNQKIGIITNAVKYSDTLCDMLRHNRAYTITSLDAGTPHLYKKIHGVNRFDKVVSNLCKYSLARGDSWVKYIITDMNASKKELAEFLEVAKQIKMNVIIDRDTTKAEDANNMRDLVAFSLEYAESIGVSVELGKTFMPAFINKYFPNARIVHVNLERNRS